ncbi:MAG: 6-carboxytetrahydropterin synthase [Xylophilus ampelinus]
MHYDISQQFHFDAAHTLDRAIEAEGSRRIHGHTYRARATVRGTPDPATGMVFDLGLLRRMLAEVRESLDHHFLDEVPGLGKPTLENLARFIAARLQDRGCRPRSVEVWRDSVGDACCLTLDEDGAAAR